ncbi:MAG: carbamoyltransferase family protein [Planctomycetota bacterium]|jgi:carbamoyltransferase
MTNILGLSCFYHDSAAALVRDGDIVAAAQEERFTRKKHDPSFPKNAADYCMKEAGITASELDFVVFYDKPLQKFVRLLETYLAFAPSGLLSFLTSMPAWLGQKLWMEDEIRKGLGYDGKLLYARHHESHAASAFFPSPFEEAAIITIDGVGEWTTTSIGVGEGNRIKLLDEVRFPHSLGMLYTAFTYYTGFRVNSGEYKVMGLAPYGEPKYVDLIKEHLIRINDDGSFRMNMKYFNYCQGLTMTNRRFEKLFGGPPRRPEGEMTQREMDLARSVQEVCEEIMLKLARRAKEKTGEKYLCLAGGVTLNCVGNGKILRDGAFEDIWIQPAAGDAGGALGGALACWYQFLDNPREADNRNDKQNGSYLGPKFSTEDIEKFLKEKDAPYETVPREELPGRVAELMAGEKVVGLAQGRMEFGPRALGARSIIGDARSPKMQKTMNLKIKYRESFRPFAPTVLEERISDWFEIDRPSPYMLLVAQVKKEKQREMTADEKNYFGLEKLNVVRSEVPAITHVDYSARIQSVNRNVNPLYHEIIKAFEDKTGCPVIINTSFNVRGEPIVCTPQDAYLCFMRTEMDYLVLENCLLEKTKQPELTEEKDWRKIYELD